MVAYVEEWKVDTVLTK
eukprot:gene10420-biopygen1056